MNQQTVIVTGASSGIGKEIARYFLEAGDNVVINSTTPDKLEKAWHDLGAGPNLVMVAGDISHKATGKELASTALHAFGSIDVLVNNAGIFESKPFLEVDEMYLDRFINTNLKGTFFTTQGVIPQMLKQLAGAVVNIGTSLVNHSFGGSPVTAAVCSKGAIHALTIQLAAEFGRQNIRVNTVAPGIIKTVMHGNGADKGARPRPVIPVGEPVDIARMVYAVAKNKFINGTIINVDGGVIAGYIK